MHTPGHTPEHVSFLVTDGAAADEPIAAATGDFIFVGDVGRPDLLERAANIKGTMESGREDAVREPADSSPSQPDWLQIWPGHGAGSACGKGISAIPHSTLGYERRFNWAFQATNEARVRGERAGRPAGAAEVLRRDEAAEQGGPAGAARLPRVRSCSTCTRSIASFTKARSSSTRGRPRTSPMAHVPGTINIPLERELHELGGLARAVHARTSI